METNQREKELEVKDFRKESKAEQLLAIAEYHNGKYRRCRNWSVFFVWMGMLLTISVGVLKIPLMNGEPIYAVDNQIVLILLLCSVLMNIIALILTKVAKKHYVLALHALIDRGNLPNVTPLWVKMM